MPPDKPKRKKNNKNKRKNKNYRGDPSKNAHNKESDCEQLPVFEDEAIDKTLIQSEVKNDKFNLLVQSTEIKQNNNIDSKDNSNLEHGSDIINNDSFSHLNEDYSICHAVDIQSSPVYFVEDPEQKNLKTKHKINSTNKSKSLDSDDVPKIVEILDEGPHGQEEDSNLVVIDSSTIIVSEVESDVEWEKTDEIDKTQNSEIIELATGKLSITTIPLDIAQCDQTKCLTFEEEASLRNYLSTLNLSTQPDNENSVEVKSEIETTINREIKHRLRKKASADDFFVQRLGAPRILDVIDEEGSGESSTTSRRQSYLNDKKSDNEDLEDDVFEDKNQLNKKFDTKITTNRNKSFGRLVPQQCVLVGAKLKEPEVTEARGDWTVQTVEKMTGAEIVYLTDSSSSTSSIHEIGDDTDDGVETDVSVRMITPTIEVTDTENFLKKTFLSSSNNSNTKSILELADKPIDHDKSVVHTIKIDVETDQNDVNKQASTSESHEIVVLSTDNIKTDLYVKDIDETKVDAIIQTQVTNTENTVDTPQKPSSEYDLELKVIKCELNDAINNLLKEVSSDSEINNDTLTRRDSSSSLGSSQCTAKYNPNFSSLNDVSNDMTHEEDFFNDVQKSTEISSGSSHVKDVVDYISGVTSQYGKKTELVNTQKPLTLKNFCLKKIASLPYGEKILEELASVSERLQYLNIQESFLKEGDINQPVSKLNNTPLSDSIDKVTFKTNKSSIPPPIKPRRSSLIKKMPEEEHRPAMPSKTESAYICLSPSQKMLIEKTNTTFLTKESSDRIETEKRHIEHRGYDEYKEMEKGYISDDSPMIPFKSQTGSRLLALIQDPKITKNVNSTKTQYTSGCDKFEKTNSITELNLTNKQKYSTFQDFSSYFKPIPPPRPKVSSSFYESDESSDFTENTLRSMKSEKKIFHYSTGNLNKEIENDISTIQNMHRFYTNVRDQLNNVNYPRRPSLPKDLCDQQMEYIRLKEREVDAEIQRLEEKSRNSHLNRKGPRAPLISQKEVLNEKIKDANNFSISRKKDILISSPCLDADVKREKGKISSLFSSSQEELQREQMYSEYVSQMAAREERKQHKIIKITNSPIKQQTVSKSLSDLELLGPKINNPIEKEFISKARERWSKLGITDPETEDEKEVNKNTYKEPKVIEHKIKVITGGKEKEIQKLPTHLQEFVRFTAKEKGQGSQDPGESKSEPASPHVVIWCAVIVIVLAVVKYLLRMLRNK